MNYQKSPAIIAWNHQKMLSTFLVRLVILSIVALALIVAILNH